MEGRKEETKRKYTTEFGVVFKTPLQTWLTKSKSSGLSLCA